jgi:hypothetical protein
MFIALADKSPKVPKLAKQKTYKMFEFATEEWEQLRRIQEVL